MKLLNLLRKAFPYFFVCALVVCGLALAETAAPASVDGTVIPDWVTPILTYFESIPKLGPVLTFLMQLVAVAGSLFTLATVFLTGSCKTLAAIAQFSNLAPLADKIQAFHDKVWPYFAYLSIFNVQKKDAPLLPPKV